MPDFVTRRTMMVDTQVRTSDVTKFPIIDAMLRIERERFVPAGLTEAAYVGENIELGGGRCILDPRTLSKMLDALDVQPHELVLDIGCAQGYSAAVLSRLAEAVVAVEEDADMARDATAILSEVNADNVAVIAAPLAEGSAKHGPYDVITIQGAVEQLPEALIAQLHEGGRIACIFMEGALGICRIGRKLDGRISWRFGFNATAPVLPGFASQPAFVF